GSGRAEMGGVSGAAARGVTHPAAVPVGERSGGTVCPAGGGVRTHLQAAGLSRLRRPPPPFPGPGSRVRAPFRGRSLVFGHARPAVSLLRLRLRRGPPAHPQARPLVRAGLSSLGGAGRPPYLRRRA